VSGAYYNELDRKAAAWLRELIAAGLIAPGDVDERSIVEVQPEDLHGYTQVHLFAGVGGWSLAARLAGWPDDRPLWTGSCPCQPFSCAGKGKGQADERHLWPEMYRLIRELRPPVIFGEQVEGAVGKGWLDGVFADLEAQDYACGAVVLGAHSVGAPHIRQRLYWLADAQRDGGRANQPGRQAQGGIADGRACVLEHAAGDGREQRRSESGGRGVICGCGDGGVGDAGKPRLEGHAGDGDQRSQPGRIGTQASGYASETGGAGPWSDFYIIPCRDGKVRRVEPGTFPLVDGVSPLMVPGGDPGEQEAQATAEARVMRLSGYGNAINPYVGAQFIKSYMMSKQ
jgi:DNA (cytosine-5)-methyltransferase 1